MQVLLKETQTKQGTGSSIWQSLFKLWNKKTLCLQMQKNKHQKEQKGTPNR
jgi:hypothetical protein